nr:hypothetical protein [uncultured Gellertiella sp.]
MKTASPGAALEPAYLTHPEQQGPAVPKWHGRYPAGRKYASTTIMTEYGCCPLPPEPLKRTNVISGCSREPEKPGADKAMAHPALQESPGSAVVTVRPRAVVTVRP